MENTSEQYWSMTEGVFNCLIDKKRSLAFMRAIVKTVKPGDVVVDMGTGSGILAMVAAKAGASRVYAVEIDKNNTNTLNQTFEVNGLADTIKIIEGDVTKVKFPEKVDVVIGEMIATALIEELQVPAMNNILKYTKRNFKVILNKYETYVDLVSNPESYYGYDFKIIRYEYPELKELHSQSHSVKTLVDVFDFTQIRKDLKIKKTFDLPITKAGTINGIRLSGKTIFCDGSVLSSTFAYSYPIILPIPTTRIKKGDLATVTLSYKVCGGMHTLKYSFKLKE